MKASKVFEYVLDMGVFRAPDYKAAEAFIAQRHDKWGGLCSAAAATAANGDMMVGRNMDLNISNKPAYIVRTRADGAYETMGLCYIPTFGPDYTSALEDGVPDTFAGLIPFLCTDVMNSEGLYVETNMRTGEYNARGASAFGCSGTNPDGRRVCSLILPRYLCERCATVGEALEYVKTLDIYTPSSGQMDWNFCFMMADAAGRYGLLEIAQNRISWLEGQRAQTNFYITAAFAADETMKAGLGRYAVLMSGIDGVRSEKDLYALMDDVSYFQIYTPEKCRFDCRSEFVGTRGNWTSEYVLDPANREEVNAAIREISENTRRLSRQELRDRCRQWESVFTLVANCTKKTIFVRFNENNAHTLTLSFDR